MLIVVQYIKMLNKSKYNIIVTDIVRRKKQNEPKVSFFSPIQMLWAKKMKRSFRNLKLKWKMPLLFGTENDANEVLSKYQTTKRQSSSITTKIKISHHQNSDDLQPTLFTQQNREQNKTKPIIQSQSKLGDERGITINWI